MSKRNDVIREMAEHEKVSVAQLALSIGKPPANLYDIQSGKLKGVSEKLADTFLEVYPDYNRSWLLTGEGEMLKRTQTITGDGNVQVAGNAHNVNAGKTLDAALREVENAHNIISKMQLQMDTLLTVIEKLTDQKK